jgi:type IV pilus assembly protein PilQ
MTVTRGLALIATMIGAGALVQATGPAASPAPVNSVRLTAISSRVHSKGASLVIEATEPVAYVASRPDPLTLLLDFHNVDSDSVANRVSEKAKGPIAGVTVEQADWLGTAGSRVHIDLAEPVGHRVRSDRNTIVVDFETPSGSVAAMSGPGAAGASRPDPIAALGLGGEPESAVATAAAMPAMPATHRSAPPARQTAGSATIQAPAPAPQPGTVLGTGQPGERRYTGHPISLDFQGADLRAVLRTFAEISGLNIVIDPRVNGTVDVALRDVPWDQALDIILKANGLGYIVDGTIVRIAPLEALEAEQKKISDLARAQAEAGQITTLTHQLSYAKGDDIVALLKQANVLSNRGTAFVDARTNTLIVTDLQDRLTSTTQLLTTLDKPQPQVEIEARIVQANKNYSRALGIQWGFNGRVDPALGNTTPLAFPNSGNLQGRTSGTQGPAAGSSTNAAVPSAVNLGVPAANSAVGLALGAINGAFNLDVALTALETSGNGRILSTPRVTTQNNIAAEMTQGTQIPIQTVANNTVTVTFKDAALSLKVTPQITAAGTVIMTISLENSQADFSRAVGGIPPIDTQRANTTVLVTDGQTTVIGGVYLTREQMTNDKTPGLGNVPLIRWLFKRDTNVTSDQELLIFITPRIIKA